VEVTGLLPPESVLTAIRQALRDKRGADEVNEIAFAKGREAVAGAKV
jgi:hypothetical protein